MLISLSIRNVVLIEALDLDFDAGLGVLTGETGAGKSILLDALGLAMGARADSGLVRAGADKASVTAGFDAGANAGAIAALLADNDLEAEPGEPILIRRQLKADGGSRAFVNDQPVSAALLRDLSALLVEVHGQHDDRGLINPRGHRALVDAYGGCDTQGVAAAWGQRQAARDALDAARSAQEQAAADKELLEHNVAEILALAPEAGEEQTLALQRADMQKGERLTGDLAEIDALFAGSDSPVANLRLAARRLDRIAPEHPMLAEALAALDRALVEVGEAEAALAQAGEALSFDPARLDAIETRLFDLRALARKHKCEVDDLPLRLATWQAALAAIEGGAESLAQLEAAVRAADADYLAKAKALSAQRSAAAARLDAAVAAELAPLKLDTARFRTLVDVQPEERWSASGMDRVEFLISTNPGSDFAPLIKIASGGELSRFILALKVALAEQGGAGTIIFDEIDRGVGGAVASAIGERLARLSASGKQLLAVTHSPQVAAKGNHHFFIAKSSEGTVTRTGVRPLTAAERREEIARMLSGAEVTPEARAQAERLLEAV